MRPNDPAFFHGKQGAGAVKESRPGMREKEKIEDRY